MADVTITLRGENRGALAAFRQTEQGFGRLDSRVSSSSRVFSRFRSVASTALKGAAVAFAGGAVAALKSAGDFERALNTFQAVSKATGDEMRQISELAKSLGRDIDIPGASAKDAAQAMTELAKGGLSVRDSMDAAKTTLQLAAAAETDNARAATIVADALNTFALRGRDAGKVADLLAGAANASTGEIDDFAMALSQSGAQAHNLRVPIEDTVAGLATLANAGVKGSDAGTSLKVMLQRLIPATDDAADAMGDLGLLTEDGNNKLFDAQGRFIGLERTIRLYHKALAPLTQEQRAQALQTIFGSDATRAASIIFGKGADTYDRLRDKVSRTGQAQDLARSKMKGFAGVLEAVRSSVETLGIQLGTRLLPVATRLGERFSKFLGSREFARYLDQAGRAASGLAGALERALPRGIQAMRTTVSVGRALTGFFRSDLGSAVGVGAAAMLAFVSAGVKVRRGIQAMRLALVGINPLWGVAALAVGVLSGAIFRNITTTDRMARAFDRAKQAVRGLRGAIDEAKQADLDASQAKLSLQAANLAHERALESLAETERRAGRGSLAYREALQQVKQTAHDVAQAQNDLAQANDRAAGSKRRVAKQAQEARARISGLKTAFSGAADAGKGLAGALSRGTDAISKADEAARAKNVRTLAKRFTDIAREAGKVASRYAKDRPADAAKAAAIQRQAAATAALIRQLGRIPTKKEINVYLKDQDRRKREIDEIRNKIKALKGKPLPVTIEGKRDRDAQLAALRRQLATLKGKAIRVDVQVAPRLSPSGGHSRVEDIRARPVRGADGLIGEGRLQALVDRVSVGAAGSAALAFTHRHRSRILAMLQPLAAVVAPAAATGSARGLQAAILDELAIGRRMGLRLTSGLRPGAITSTGARSLHGTGQAIDMAGPPSLMARFARAVAGRPRIREVIYTPVGAWYPTSGWVRPSGSVAADHYDHVHVGTGDGRVGVGDGRVAGTGDAYGQRYTPRELGRALLAAGVTGRNLILGIAIALAESGGRNVRGDRGQSHGPWQIHRPSWPGLRNTDSLAGGAQAFAHVLQRQGLRAWTVFRTGAFRRFLGDATQAVRGVGEGVAAGARAAATVARREIPRGVRAAVSGRTARDRFYDEPEFSGSVRTTRRAVGSPGGSGGLATVVDPRDERVIRRQFGRLVAIFRTLSPMAQAVLRPAIARIRQLLRGVVTPSEANAIIRTLNRVWPQVISPRAMATVRGRVENLRDIILRLPPEMRNALLGRLNQVSNAIGDGVLTPAAHRRVIARLDSLREAVDAKIEQIRENVETAMAGMDDAFGTLTGDLGEAFDRFTEREIENDPALQQLRAELDALGDVEFPEDHPAAAALENYDQQMEDAAEAAEGTSDSVSEAGDEFEDQAEEIEDRWVAPSQAALDALRDWKSPARLALEALEEEQEDVDLGRRLADAEEALERALRLADPQMIQEAQRDVDDVRRAMRRDELEEQAAHEEAQQQQLVDALEERIEAENEEHQRAAGRERRLRERVGNERVASTRSSYDRENDAVRQGLEDQLDTARTGWQKQQDARREEFERQITSRERELRDAAMFKKRQMDAEINEVLEGIRRGEITREEGEKRILAIVEKYIPEWRTRGAILGAAFAEGLDASFVLFQRAVDKYIAERKRLDEAMAPPPGPVTDPTATITRIRVRDRETGEELNIPLSIWNVHPEFHDMYERMQFGGVVGGALGRFRNRRRGPWTDSVPVLVSPDAVILEGAQKRRVAGGLLEGSVLREAVAAGAGAGNIDAVQHIHVHLNGREIARDTRRELLQIRRRNGFVGTS